MNQKLYKLCLFPLFIISAQAFAGANDAIELISSDAAGLHFRIKIDSERLDFVVNADSQLVIYQTIQFGLPYGATPRIDFARGSGGPVSLTERVRAFSAKSFAPRPLAELGESYSIRGRRMASLMINPVASEGVYSEIEIRVGFSGGQTVVGQPMYDPNFERLFKASLINFDAFRSFMYPESRVAKSFAAQGPFSGVSQWLRISVDQTSLHRITGGQLQAAGWNLSGLSSASLHLYNGGGLPLEVLNELPRPTFEEVAVIINDGGDGLFGAGDNLLFYGEAVNRFIYPSTDSIRFVNNAYANRNCYWLGIDTQTSGKRMAAIDGSINGAVGGNVDTVISSYPHWVHVEQDNMLRRFADGKITDYYRWFWSDQNQLSFFVPTPNLLAGDTVEITLVGRTLDTTTTLDEFGYIDFFVNGVKGIDKTCGPLGCTYRSAQFVAGLNQVDMNLTSNLTVAPYFDYMDLVYQSNIVPASNKLDLTLGSTDADAEIRVTNNFSVTPLILDISDPRNPVRVTGGSPIGGNLVFYVPLVSSRFNRFNLSVEGEALAPSNITAAAPADLYAVNEQADLIIVTPRNLITALDAFVSYREGQGHSIKVTAIEDVIDNFGFGVYDPTAIRDYLKFAYETYPAPSPSAAMMVGDGTYDFLNRLGSGMPNFVPPYIHPYDESASDDNYVYFGAYGLLDSDTTYSGTDRGFDMIISRWPVRTASEIAVITNKVVEYESPSDFGNWRMKVTLVADDEFGAFDNEVFHVTQTETLEKSHLPRIFTRQKIYLWDYPFVNNMKPAVNDAIVSAINNGTLLINYVGHGNPDVWAHEHVFTRDADLPRLHNTGRLPLVFAASCAIGFFDNPLREAMGEDLLAMSGGGAVGVISATRLVFSSDNSAYNRAAFDVIFGEDTLSICEAVYAAKLRRQYVGGNPIPLKNDRNYLYFGDPFTRLNIPRFEIEFTSAPDSLVALGLTTVSGRVVDDNGSLYNQDGSLVVTVYDSQRDRTYRLLNSNGQVLQTVTYAIDGPTIYRGNASVEGGQFDFQFLPPLDIGFGGRGASISAYASFADIDAAGLVDSIDISDSIAAFNDSLGPAIEIGFVGRSNFISGDIIGPQEQLNMSFEDASGINLAGGLGHGITLEVDNDAGQMKNLTPLFEYETDNFVRGSLSYALEGLSAGKHNFKVKAWDNANNSSVSEFEAEVMTSTALRIVDLLNYPNPMNQATRFSYTLTSPVEKLSLEIFTLSGRKIKSFERYSLEPGYYDDIEWYGQDHDGHRVATEVYIYKATAYPSGGGDRAEAFGKVVVIN